MFEERFEFSRHPKELGWYRCYDDLSRDEWLDGSELWQNKDAWDEKAVAKWHFFYRPFRPAVGRPQKKMIRERYATIGTCETYSRQARQTMAEERQGLVRARNTLLTWSAVTVLMALVLMANDLGMVAMVVLAGGIAVAGQSFWKTTSQAESRIQELERCLAGYEESIRKNRHEIGLLRQEIAELCAQIPAPVTLDQIQEWLHEEIGRMELACLGDFLGREITREDAGQYLQCDFGDARVFGLLIDSWGALQPARQKGPLGQESTGLSKAQTRLGEHMSTWQVGLDDRPVFRLLFLQYLLPLEKNLNVCSFFYDFITRQVYGKRYETFQYNHVTNYSIRELQPEEEPWAQEAGLLAIARLLMDKELRALTISVASGNHFRCVLVDEDVVDVLNRQMSHQEKYQALAEDLLDEEQLEAERQKLARESQTLQQVARPTRLMLNHVRNCVEHYALRVQEPA